jgi:hypothetical protein
MKALNRITDPALGHLVLPLIGARSPRGPEPGLPTRLLPVRGARPSGAGRTGVTAATTPRVAA